MNNKTRFTNVPIILLDRMIEGEYEESMYLRCNTAIPVTQKHSVRFNNELKMRFFLRYYPIYDTIQFTKITITLN